MRKAVFALLLTQICRIVIASNITTSLTFDRRQLLNTCDQKSSSNNGYAKYFEAMKSIYLNSIDNTCLPQHISCGWPSERSNSLPLFVLSIGLEGAGHHLWTQLLEQPVFDCVWINGRHYQRDIADGVPRSQQSIDWDPFSI